MSKNRIKIPVLSFLALSIYTSLSQASIGDSELNTAFLQGTREVPSILKTDVLYPTGSYYIDVSLNGKGTGRSLLIITPKDEEAGQLCLSPVWLRNAGIFFVAGAYSETFDAERNCYELGRKIHTRINFDHGSQKMDFVIPQAWLAEKNDAARWDYGINGFRMTYNGNFNKNVLSHNTNDDESLNAYGQFNTSLNFQEWVLSSDMNATRNTQGNEFNVNNITLSRAISEIQGDLLFGKSQTRSELFNDFGFYGIAIRSNNSMRSWNARGYAPIISGVASTTSRVTIIQGGYTIYSRVVPPGPYHLDDISPVSNGNLLVTVEDSSGHKVDTEYPVSTLPSLLRPSEFNYNVAFGQKNSSNNLDKVFSSDVGTFMLGSLDYGLSSNTVNMAVILHNQYQAGGLGLTQPFGRWGAVAGSINASQSKSINHTSRKGVSVSLKYAKSFSRHTDLQLLSYRYQGPGYIEFADWSPDSRYQNLNGREKARYEARLSHRLESIYLSGSFWQQTYWNRPQDSFGASLSANTNVFNGVSLFLSGNYSRSAWQNRDDYSTSLGVSIPFTLGGVRHYSSNSMSYNRSGGTSFNTNASATVNSRLNYSVNAGSDSKHNSYTGVSVSYAFDRVQTNFALSHDRNKTTLSGNLSGSAVVTDKTGLLLTKESSDTIAVVKIKGISGVTFNGSLPTNADGETVLNLSSYSPSSININMENLPENTELLNTSYDVLPTEKAIIYREFGVENVLRYIVRVRDSQGRTLTGGSAKTEQNLNAGFISTNGVLLMNLLAVPKTINISLNDGQQCLFQATGLRANINSVQEIHCE